MKRFYCCFLLAFATIPCLLMAQNVGIGTNSPLSRLHVEQGNVLFIGPSVLPAVPAPLLVSSTGARLMWYPDKAAFRVGYVSFNSWDSSLIGRFSFAAGKDVTAQGSGSVALGSGSNAAGLVSIAIGSNCIALDSSIALGKSAQSFGTKAVAIGNNAYSGSTNGFAIGNSAAVPSSGIYAFAIGNTVTASGAYSTAIGNNSGASGDHSIAMGYFVSAGGANSLSLGSYVSTNGYTGAFALGDASTTTVMNSFVANGFRSRFAGGYRLFTNSAANVGAFLNANANSWAALSDVRIKENFLPVNGESFLQKIAAMPQYTWNYIGQDVGTLRHYGPMAQDFYKAFGKDDLGEIGCDTLINQQDFLGVNLIAIQALEKRTEKINDLEKRLDKLQKENTLMRAQMSEVLELIKAKGGCR